MINVCRRRTTACFKTARWEVEGEQEKLCVGGPKLDPKFLVQSLLLSVGLPEWGARLVKTGMSLLTGFLFVMV